MDKLFRNQPHPPSTAFIPERGHWGWLDPVPAAFDYEAVYTLDNPPARRQQRQETHNNPHTLTVTSTKVKTEWSITPWGAGAPPQGPCLCYLFTGQ